LADVDFPAPFGPAMTTTLGFYFRRVRFVPDRFAMTQSVGLSVELGQ